jgi:hypothetical protein
MVLRESCFVLGTLPIHSNAGSQEKEGEEVVALPSSVAYCYLVLPYGARRMTGAGASGAQEALTDGTP